MEDSRQDQQYMPPLSDVIELASEGVVLNASNEGVGYEDLE